MGLDSAVDGRGLDHARDVRRRRRRDVKDAEHATASLVAVDDEAETLDRMHREFIPESGSAMSGKHHEIYLSDFRKVEPAKLRTILRQPVVAAAA